MTAWRRAGRRGDGSGAWCLELSARASQSAFQCSGGRKSTTHPFLPCRPPWLAHLVESGPCLSRPHVHESSPGQRPRATAGWASALGLGPWAMRATLGVLGAFSCLRLASKRPDTGLSAVVCIPTLPRLSPPRDTLNSGFLPFYPSSPTSFLPLQYSLSLLLPPFPRQLPAFAHLYTETP